MKRSDRNKELVKSLAWYIKQVEILRCLRLYTYELLQDVHSHNRALKRINSLTKDKKNKQLLFKSTALKKAKAASDRIEKFYAPKKPKTPPTNAAKNQLTDAGNT